MDEDRKRKSPGYVGAGKDTEDKKRRIGRDVRNPCDGEGHDGAGEVAFGERRAAEDAVEAEVEEFFAIVRRMQAAARHISVSGGRMTPGSARQAPREDETGLDRWRPSFEWEDFEDVGHHNLPKDGERSNGRRGEVASSASAPITAEGGGGKREERTTESGIAVRLDLNVEPEPERVLG